MYLQESLIRFCFVMNVILYIRRYIGHKIRAVALSRLNLACSVRGYVTSVKSGEQEILIDSSGFVRAWRMEVP